MDTHPNARTVGDAVAHDATKHMSLADIAREHSRLRAEILDLEYREEKLERALRMRCPYQIGQRVKTRSGEVLLVSHVEVVGYDTGSANVRLTLRPFTKRGTPAKHLRRYYNADLVSDLSHPDLTIVTEAR